MRTLSGNHKGWLNAVAREIREAGKPVSLDFLYCVVPSQFATATNDGHVTAAENGLSRDDYKAGWRIWIEETVAALIKAKLIETVADGYAWVAEQDGTWKVKFGRSTYTLYGQAESAGARDRHMLGESTEAKVVREPEEQPGYLLKGYSEVEVEVAVGIRNKIDKGKHTLQVHPLAFAIPPMTPAEQELVRGDIAKHGVRTPLILYPDPADLSVKGKPKLKVLDGRHRLQFASALGKPVRVEVFEGTEQEAREYVWSVNAARRHLTKEQRALSLVRLFGKQADEEAAEALRSGQIKGNKSRSPSVTISSPTGNGQTHGKKAYERVWELAGAETSGVTKNAVRQMMPVADAPNTAARIDNGERLTLAQARTAAREELGLPKETKQEARTYPTSVASELGRAEKHMQTAWDERDGPIGAVAADVLRGRLDEIDRLSTLLRDELKRRGQF